MSFSKRLLSGGPAPFVNDENFRTVTYSGNSGVQSITGVGFKPDLVWIKDRSNGEQHVLNDSTRGATKDLSSNLTSAEATRAEGITSFDDDGFTLGPDGGGIVNDSSRGPYVAWCWKATGGSTSSNTNGDNTSTVQANTDAGFSIVKWNGGTSEHSVGHGLGVKPEVVIVKELSGSYNWNVYYDVADGSLDYVRLNLTNAGANSSRTIWTSSLFYWSGNHTSDVIAYAFHSVTGFSKFGTYTGNGDATGPIVQTGFEPAFIMIKRIDSSDNWSIRDNARSTVNPRKEALFANLTQTELTSGYTVDFLSNGFQVKTNDNAMNNENGVYLYMAFAANPDEEAPALASSFNAETYYGTGASGNSVSGIGFQPNFLWTKSIAGSTNDFSHTLMNSIRGASQSLNSNNTNAETTNANGLESFDSDGFTVGSGAGGWNYDGTTYVGWSWKANDDEPKTIPEVNKRVRVNQGSSNYFAINSVTGSSGKYYFEVEFSSLLGQAANYGTMMAGLYTSGYVAGWQNTRSRSYYSSNGNRYKGSTSYSYGSSYTEGDIIGIAVNGDDDEVTFYKNNSSQGTAFSGSEGDSSFGIQLSTGLYAYEAKIYLDENNWTYSPPSGFSEWTEAKNAYNRNDITVSGAQLVYDNMESTVSVNANAGFSIVEFTNSGPGSYARVPHGLSSTPEMIIVKRHDGTEDWYVYHTSMGLSKYMRLNLTDGQGTATNLFNTVNATVFNPSFTTSINQKCIAYCWHSVTGYSDFGSYTGNGTAGQTITTGFKPDWVLIKSTVGADNWRLYDTKRGVEKGGYLEPNRSDADDTSNAPNLKMLSTGFEITSGGVTAGNNANGNLYIYAAFAKNVPSSTTLADSFGITEYVGTASSRDISGFSFRPDLIWIKSKSGTTFHNFANSVSGPSYIQYSNSNSAGERNDGIVSYFNSDGARVGSDNSSNQNNQRFIAWAWKAGNTWQSNIDGNIPSTINVNTSAGFSIAKVKGSGSTDTFGHGLGSTPEVIIRKNLDATDNWNFYTTLIDGSLDYLNLNLTNAKGDSSYSAPTSTVFTNPGDTNERIYYSFVSVAGFSKFGTYTGNGSSTGPTVTTGFQPDFIMIKRTDGTNSWAIVDSLRGGGQELYANLTDADNAYAAVDFLSNGFQIINTANGYNANGSNYVYMAFKQNATLNTTKESSFNIQTYTGTGSERTVENFGFKPDLVWTKRRSHSGNHGWFDSVRGPGKELATNDSGADQTSSGTIISFDSNGFTAGSNWALNNTNYTYVAWAWKAGNAWVNNHDGAVESIVNYNTGNKFSIVQWEGTGSATTVGHGMGTAPTFIIAKTLESSAKWRVYHSALGGTKYLNLNDIYAEGTSANVWNDTTPTTSLFGVGSDLSPSGEKVIAYCWADVTGYSKFGSYSGNGTTQTISTGFQPDFVMIRANTGSTTHTSWIIFDSVRYGSSSNTNPIYANLSAAEGTRGDGSGDGDVLEISFTSTGFKIGDSGSNNASDEMNDSNKNYIYVAFKIN